MKLGARTALGAGKARRFLLFFLFFQIKMVSAYILYPFNLVKNSPFLIAFSTKYQRWIVEESVYDSIF